MSIATIPFTLYPTPQIIASYTGSIVIDAANEKAGCVFVAPITGSITKLTFVTGTVTTGAVLDVRLETVADANKLPSGTLVDANTNGACTVANTDDNKVFEVTLTSAASVTAGQVYAIVVSNPGASYGNMQIRTASGHNSYNIFSVIYAASWSQNIGTVCMGACYSTGYTYIPYMNPGITVLTAQAFQGDTTPDEYGAYFKVAGSVRVRGIWANDGSNSGACERTYKLYDSDGSTLLESVEYKKRTYAAGGNINFYFFDSSVTLSADTWYRMTIMATNTTWDQILTILTLDDVKYRPAMPGGDNFYLTSRTDAGAWTETTTLIPQMGLIIDGVDDGTGAGATPVPFGYGFAG